MIFSLYLMGYGARQKTDRYFLSIDMISVSQDNVKRIL